MYLSEDEETRVPTREEEEYSSRRSKERNREPKVLYLYIVLCINTRLDELVGGRRCAADFRSEYVRQQRHSLGKHRQTLRRHKRVGCSIVYIVPCDDCAV